MSAEQCLALVAICAPLAAFLAGYLMMRDRVAMLERQSRFMDDWRKQVSKELDLHIQWMRVTQDELAANKAKEQP